MKHHYTKEEMGKGFAHNEIEHKENDYNYLMDVELYEKNTLRTHYLIRDIWTKKQLMQLYDFLHQNLKELELDEADNTLYDSLHQHLYDYDIGSLKISTK